VGPDDLRHSERLGIRYGGHGARIDGASILVLTTDRLRGGGTLLDATLLEPDGPYARLAITLLENRDSPPTTYYGQWAGGRWWLRHPVLVAIEGWPVRESAYLRVIRHVEIPFNELAVAQLDRFVESAARALDLEPALLERVRREKVDWIVGPELVMHELIGAPAHGVANLQLDAVLTQHAYHPHELAHILVNLARGEQPAAVLPMMQEGLAVHLGGRFNSSAAMQKEFGAVLLRGGIVELADLLAHDAFRRLQPDLSYAPSALFVEFLFERLGSERFLELYGSLSGPFETVAAWSPEEIEGRLASSLGLAPADLEPSFRRFWEARPGDLLRTLGPAPLLDSATLQRAGSCEAQIELADDTARVVLRGSSPDSLICALVWPQREPSLPQSPLFAEHFPGREYAGERFALVIAPGEVGFYDYGLDRLVAKRADGFDPDPLFWDADEGVLRFELELTGLPTGIERALLQGR
jgi:hypothetical protein